MFQPKEIEDFYSAWRGFYTDNDARGDSCVSYALGNQWDAAVVNDRSIRGEESLVFNIAQKHLLRVKGEAEKLDLSLSFKGKNLDPILLKEGRHILNQLILCNDHLSAFRRVLHKTYDYGYGALLVTTKQCSHKEPFEVPYLRVIKDPRKVFFDISSEDDFKTEGKYCGIVYSVDVRDLFGKDTKRRREKSDKTCKVIDFWYREPEDKTFYFSNRGRWESIPSKDYLVKKKVRHYSVKFMRVVDGEVIEGPLDYYTTSKLPLIYWKGLEGEIYDGITRNIKTMPFIYNLYDVQSYVNYAGSAVVGRLKKLGGTKVLVTSDMIEGQTNSWQDFNRRSGVLQINESDDGTLQQPMIIPAESVDANLLNTMQQAIQIMDQLSGINQAQQGEGQQVATNSGLHRQIMQGNILQNVMLANHLRAINEVGRILKEMIPNVIIEERDIGDGYSVNKTTNESVPSSPSIKNDIKELFSNIDFSIEYGPSSDAEKAANLLAVKELMSTNQNLAQFFADEFVDNLNTANSEKLKRRIEALMPPGIQEVGDGLMSVEEYRQMQQQQAEQQQQQPSLEQQKLELEQQKVQGDQQLKAQDLQLKAAKMQQQGMKDAKNLQIKEAGIVSKLQPKEMIYEKGGKNANP